MGLPSRRNVILGAGGVVALFALGGATKALCGTEPLLRPPGGQDESHLLATCIKCNRCRSACPRGIVVEPFVESGLINARTPILDFHRGYCDFCDKCIQACPTGALRPFDETVEKIGVAVVNESECLAWRSDGCRKCADACPYGAISIDAQGKPVVDDALCNGCGVCENLCPSATYGSYSGSKQRGIYVQAGGGHEIA